MCRYGGGQGCAFVLRGVLLVFIAERVQLRKVDTTGRRRSTGLLDLLGDDFFDISNEPLVSGSHLSSVCLARGIQEIRTFWETTSGIIPRTLGTWQSSAWCRAVRLRSTWLRLPLGDDSRTCFRIQLLLGLTVDTHSCESTEAFLEGYTESVYVKVVGYILFVSLFLWRISTFSPRRWY